MKIQKKIVCLSISILVCFLVGYSKSQNTISQTDNTLTKKSVELLTFKYSEEFKATLYSRPLIHTVKGIDGKDIQLENIMYYVEYSSIDSKDLRRIWQCEFAINTSIPQSTPHNFIFGPMNEDKFCLAFLHGLSVCFFILDSNNEYQQQENVPIEYNRQSPTMRIIEQDPNNVILLTKIFDKKLLPMFTPEEISVNAVSACADVGIIHISIAKEQMILCFPLNTEKRKYSIYKVSKNTK